mmetsp:Transcript_4099/g.11923  ORF Transcript_4099/g.11923 Transcript_4099/m.11923 type:complete len:347 (+) Transcript_4099:30-1070(+)
MYYNCISYSKKKCAGKRRRHERSHPGVGELLPTGLVDSLDHGLDLLPRSQLVQTCLSVGDEGLDQGLPLNGLDELPHEELLDLLFLLGEGSGGHVGVNRDPWLAQGDRGEDLLQVVGSRLHEGRVECSRDGNLLRFQGALRGGELGKVVESLVVATHHTALREEVICHLANHFVVPGLFEVVDRLLANVGDVLVAQSDDGEHSVRVSHRRGLCHALASHLYDLERILEAHHAREDERGVLPEGEPSRAAALLHRLVVVLLEHLDRGHGANEESGLGVDRVVELALGAVQADVEEIVPQDFLGLVEHLLHARDAKRVLDHPDGLRPLAREKEGDWRVQASGWLHGGR